MAWLGFLLALGVLTTLWAILAFVFSRLIARNHQEAKVAAIDDGFVEITSFDTQEEAEAFAQILSRRGIESRLGESFMVKPKPSDIYVAPFQGLMGLLVYSLIQGRRGSPRTNTPIALMVRPEDEDRAIEVMREPPYRIR